jgi:5-enolpyruvylshikimate-3-phosphate synthase
MTSVRVYPGVRSGMVHPPPSKSYTHRALIAGHLARRKYAVDNPLDADDT